MICIKADIPKELSDIEDELKAIYHSKNREQWNKFIEKITKIKPQLSTTGGTSDARFIRKIAPCLEFGLVGKTMHKVDEAVSISDLKKLTKIYSSILENYFEWKLV